MSIEAEWKREGEPKVTTTNQPKSERLPAIEAHLYAEVVVTTVYWFVCSLLSVAGLFGMLVETTTHGPTGPIFPDCVLGIFGLLLQALSVTVWYRFFARSLACWTNRSAGGVTAEECQEIWSACGLENDITLRVRMTFLGHHISSVFGLAVPSPWNLKWHWPATRVILILAYAPAVGLAVAFLLSWIVGQFVGLAQLEIPSFGPPLALLAVVPSVFEEKILRHEFT